MDKPIMSTLIADTNEYQHSDSDSQNLEELLISNIEQYKTQLDEVNVAIDSANEEDKTQLQELQLNLIHILELTLNQLTQNQSTVVPASPSPRIPSEGNENDIDDEFERFKVEIAQLDECNEEKKEVAQLDECNEEKQKVAVEEGPETNNTLKDGLKSLEGQNVRVPFMERWGGFSYHNAIVLSLFAEQDEEINYENPEVLVLYSQPTCLSMLPCRFFLDGRCNFDAEQCKFSHGKRVAVSKLKEYIEPDRDSIVAGSKVLALHEGQDIWHRGTVEDVLENRAGFSVNCSLCGVMEAPLQAMIPLFADEDQEQSSVEHHETLPDAVCGVSEKEETTFVPTEVWLKNPLATKLGDWEKHTKGIGSKLMAQMGYVVGTGLGPTGEGRVDPVPAFIYPQGVSLDHCMHLRESSGKGENIYDVEKRLLSEQKKEEDKRKEQSKYLHANTSVFDIINNRLSNKGKVDTCPTEGGGDKYSMDVSKSSLKKNSTKELNLKNFQLSSRIDKLKSEVRTLKKTKNRQSKDAATIKSIDNKLQGHLEEISSLERAERQIESEQQSRKNMKKLCLF